MTALFGVTVIDCDRIVSVAPTGELSTLVFATAFRGDGGHDTLDPRPSQW